MQVYSKCVSRKRFSQELILEKMKHSTEFAAFINVSLIMALIYTTDNMFGQFFIFLTTDRFGWFIVKLLFIAQSIIKKILKTR